MTLGARPLGTRTLGDGTGDSGASLIGYTYGSAVLGRSGSYLDLPGASGDYISTPDHASLDITGDIDIRVYDVAADVWAAGATQRVVTKYGTTANQRSYALHLSGAGTPTVALQCSVDGVTTTTLARAINLAGPTPVDGELVEGLRGVRVAATGEIKLYRLIGGVWTQLGASVLGTAGAIFSGTTGLAVGARLAAEGERFAGTIGRVEVRDGIDGTIVANPDFSIQWPGQRSFTDSTGKVWTLSGATSINGWSSSLVGTPSLAAHGSAVLTGQATISPNGTVVVNGRAVLSGRARLIATAPFVQSWDPTKQTAQYRIRVVDLSGDGYTDFENAVISDVVWELNGIGSCKFVIPVLDAKAVHIKIPEREVQVWRGNQLLWWGVMVRATADNANLAIQCSGLKWYFTRRFMGKVDRTNYLNNPSFEGDFTGGYLGLGTWNMGFRSPLEPYANRVPAYWLFETRTDKAVTGSRSLYAEQIHATLPKYGISAGQQFIYEIDDETDPAGTEWTFAVWVYIVSAKWRGAHLESGGTNDGIHISRYSTTETISITPEGGGAAVLFPKPIESVHTPIDENTPQDTWVRLECTLRQPFKAGEPEFIQVGVEVPNGAMYIDAASFTLSEKTAFYDKDQALIIEGLVDHAQDPAYGKSSLNFAKNIPLTGVVRTREYWHSEHQQVGDSLDEFHTLNEGVDTDIVITPASRTYTSYYPRKGIERADLVLELGRNIETFSVSYVGDETSNSIVVLGDGSGSDREEGGAMDANALTDGLILERVFNAIPGSHVRTLDDQAARGLQRLKTPVVIPSITTYEGSTRLIGVLQTGDVIPVRISHGFVQVNAKYRIISITLDPQTERLTYAINPAETSYV